MLILVFPLAFRMTCYYYRGAYYKAFWADPPACAVGEPRKSYRGEASCRSLIQNVHRYFLYFALLFIVLLSIDVWKGFWFNDPATGHADVRHRRRHAGPADQRRPARQLHASAATRCATWSAACIDSCRSAPLRKKAYDCVELPQPAPPDVGLVQPVLGRLHRSLHPPLRDGHLHDLRIF